MGASWSNQNYDSYSEDSSLYEYEEESEVKDLSEDNVRRIHSQHTDEETMCMDSATDTKTDAVSPGMLEPISITLDKVMLIENALDLYEKVSLVYLLFKDSSMALCQLTKLLSGSIDNVIYKWASSEYSTNTQWQQKLIESICIIQNYEVLRNLGFSKQSLTERFLPHNISVTENLNKIRKLLYGLCESFGPNDTEILLSFVCSDFQKKGLKFHIYNSSYLEMYLLHWEVIGYISYDNLSNLCAILKQMDQLDWYERLKEVFPPVQVKSEPVFLKKVVKLKENKKSKHIFDKILDHTTSLADLTSLESLSADNVDNENKYYINPKHPGVCLIINQENFYKAIDTNLQHLLPPRDNKLDARTGTKQDKEKLETTFKEFGFKTISRDNLTHSEIIQTVNEVVESVTVDSSLFICIMSHGDEGCIYGVNSCRVDVKKIQNIMCNKNRVNLSGKPKVMILQSCQGTRCLKISSSTEDEDNVTDSPSSSELVPPLADLLTFWATVPGYGAIRNKKTGSWFIQTLCDKMKTHGNEYHFEDICTSVIRDVSRKKWSQTNGEVAMVPLKDSTFRKHLFLPPIKN